MSSSQDTPPSPTLSTHLTEEFDDADDTRWKAPLAALIDGTQTPSQAAQAINTLLRTETSSRLAKLQEYAAQHTLSADERESGDWDGLYAPNAGALVQGVLRSWVRVCSAYAPYSEGQNRLVEFLEELRGLPRWNAAESRPDEEGNVDEVEVWKFGFGWLGLEDEFRRVHVDLKPGYYRDPAAHNRWRNFQHAMARLTANQLIYCAPFNALQDITPSAGSSSTRSLEFDIIAAAQWVAWPTECRYVYQECLKKPVMEHYWEPWSKMQWKLWISEFGRVVEDTKYDDQTKSVARKALQQMKDIEEEINEEGSVGGSDD